MHLRASRSGRLAAPSGGPSITDLSQGLIWRSNGCSSASTRRPAAPPLVAGRSLPSEERLKQEHGLARGTVRHAMRVLADEGLVEVVAGRGVFVIER